MKKSPLAIVATSLALFATQDALSQSAQPSSTHATPSAAQQGGTHLDGSVTPGPNIGMQPGALPPTTPGVGREGAQPSQTGSAQQIQPGLPRPRGGAGRQTLSEPQLTPNTATALPTTQPLGTQRPVRDAEAPIVEDELVTRSARTSIGTPFRRQLAMDAQRRRILGDLRAKGHFVEDWRVLPHDGYWWYYTPERTWMMLNDSDDWIAYSPNIELRPPRDFEKASEVTFPAGYPRDRWRLVFHEGRWWFWTPEETWVYQSEGRWVAFRPATNGVMGAQDPIRQRVGFRETIAPLNRETQGVPPIGEPFETTNDETRRVQEPIP